MHYNVIVPQNQYFYDSGERGCIRILYRLYFDREPGAEELAGWVKMLENGASLEEIVNGFAGSDEFKTIVNEMKN